MKEFTTAIEDIEAGQQREDKIVALMKPESEGGKGLSRQHAEAEVDRGVPVEFKLDGRPMKAYPPHEGQLVFMMASMGRGQSQESRFASIVNIMMECLDEDDQDYFEGRLLDGNPKTRLPASQVEAIFEYLAEEWFARPTQQPSGSA